MQDQPQDRQADGESSIRAALTITVARRIKEAMDARSSSGIEEIWDEDTDQYNGVDAVSAQGRHVKTASAAPKNDGNSGRAKFVLNITKPKTDVAVARIQEMLVPTDDKPWEIGPTPIPEFAEAVDSESQQMLTLADGTQAPASAVAKVAMEKARAKSEKMALWVEDKFVEGSVYAEMRKMIEMAGRLGTGVLKGPFPVARTQRKWDTSSGVAVLAIKEETTPTSRCISVRDCFPDPACGESIHNGSYFVERDYCTTRQLKRLAKIKGEDGEPAYDVQAITEALKEGPKGRARQDNRLQDQPGDTALDSDIFELYYYYGDLEPETLLEMGVPQEALREEDLYLASVPSIVTMLNDRPIKVSINPLESGEFPYDFFPWERVEGQPYGRGIPRKMEVPQRMLIASTRALFENAGLSAGVQIAVAPGVMRPAGGGNYRIQGNTLWEFTPNETITRIQDAMHIWEIPSVQQELSNIIVFARQMADELTNLPMLMQGQQGSAPELLGGMQMLMNNAAAPLRVIAKQFDDYVIVPHLRRYYDWGMQSGPDDAKGDMQIKARGSTALVQREIQRDFLIQAHGLSQRPNSRIDPDKLDEQLFKASGVPFDLIAYTEEEWKQKQDAAKNQPPPQDPRVEAAKIRAESDQMRAQSADQIAKLQMEHRQREHERDIEVKALIANVQKEIQIMRLAAEENMQIGAIKSELAAKTIDSRDRRELFAAERALKLDPANPTNQGV